MPEVDHEVFEGKHSAPEQFAERWSVSADTVSCVFADEPGVISQSSGPLEECFYRSFRISAIVARRAHHKFRVSASRPDIRAASQREGVR
jgi:hypothetical protein